MMFSLRRLRALMRKEWIQVTRDALTLRFIILVPVVWNLTRETKRSLLFYGLPMAAALTINHALVPPHPAPAAATQLLGGDLGKTILYGVMLSVPSLSQIGVIMTQILEFEELDRQPNPDNADEEIESGGLYSWMDLSVGGRADRCIGDAR